MFHTIVESAYWIGFVGATVLLWMTKFNFHTRSTVTTFALFWTLIGTYEFWILGNKSFLVFGSELDFSVSGLLAFASQPTGSKFLHGFAGGADLDVVTQFTGQFLSLERLLVENLSLGFANFFHKTLLMGLGFAGMYRLCRGFPSMDRGMATATAAFFSVYGAWMNDLSWGSSLGFSLVPLICHVVVGRLGRRYYWTNIFIVGLVHATSCTPSHSVVGLLPAIFCIAILHSWKSAIRCVPGVIFILALILLNWHESLYAKAISAPFMARGGEDAILPTIQVNLMLFLAITGCLISFLHRFSTGLKISSALTLMYFSTDIVHSIIKFFPIFSVLEALTLQYLQSSQHVLVFLALGMSIRCLQLQPNNFKMPFTMHLGRIAFVGVAAMAIGHFTYARVYNPLVWLSQGGMSTLSAALRQLNHTPWLPDKPVRTVTVPYRISSNFVAASGLDTFDGIFNLGPAVHLKYWRQAVAPSPVYSSHAGMYYVKTNFKCCDSYDVNEFVDLDLLRAANVGFIVSVVSLRGRGITQVGGAVDSDLPRSYHSSGERIRKYLNLIFNPAPIRIYALEKPLPRIFAARGIKIVPEGMNTKNFHALVKQQALKHIVVGQPKNIPAKYIKTKSLLEKSVLSGNLQLGPWELGHDRVDVAIKGGSGLVIFNTSYLPFWQARANGVNTPVFPVNGVQMAAIVPAGTKTIEFLYNRPTLRSSWFDN